MNPPSVLELQSKLASLKSDLLIKRNRIEEQKTKIAIYEEIRDNYLTNVQNAQQSLNDFAQKYEALQEESRQNEDLSLQQTTQINYYSNLLETLEEIKEKQRMKIEFLKSLPKHTTKGVSDCSHYAPSPNDPQLPYDLLLLEKTQLFLDANKQKSQEISQSIQKQHQYFLFLQKKKKKLIHKIHRIQDEFDSANKIYQTLEEQKQRYVDLQAKINQKSEITLRDQEITNKIIKFHHQQKGVISQNDEARILELIPQLQTIQPDQYTSACDQYNALRLQDQEASQQRLSQKESLVNFFESLQQYILSL